MDLNSERVRRIGRKSGIQFALIGILIGWLMYALILKAAMNNWDEALLWPFRVKFAINIAFGAVATILAAAVVGRWAAMQILIRKRNYVLIGIATALMVLWMGTLMGSLPGFVLQGLSNESVIDAARDYIWKPLSALSIFGFIPSLVLGTAGGRRVYTSTNTQKQN